jgi:hypothetical protein
MPSFLHDLFEEVDRRLARMKASMGYTGSTLDAGVIGGALPPSVLPDLAGDVTGPPGTNVVEAIQGVAIDPAAPTAGDVLTATSATDAEWAAPGAATSLTVKEQDGAPDVSDVIEIRVPNGSLTDEGGGAVSISTTSATADHDHTTTSGDGGDLDGARIGDFLEFTEVSAPSTPASGLVRVYAKSDGSMYQKDDAGTETGLAGGGGSGAMTQLAETIVTGSVAADITFSSISGSYRHLLLTLVGRGDTAATSVSILVQLNADTGSNYDREILNIDGSTTPTDSGRPEG